VMDRADGATEKAYLAFPRRLVLIGRGGRIAQDLGLGLVGEWNLDKVGAWLDGRAQVRR